MSMLNTESFGAFGTYNGSDAFDPAPGQGNQARAAYALNLQRAGYKVFMPSNADADTSGGFVVRPDPIYPERNAMCHSSDAGSAVNLGTSAALKVKLPVIDKQIVVGFGVYIPPEYVPNGSSSTVPVLRVNATVDTDASWYDIAVTAGSIKEIFRVCNDLSLRWGTDAPQSGKKLAVGAMNYLELRIDPAAVSVWIDDVFVMQKTISVVSECIAFCFENNANAGVGGTNMSGLPGRWAVTNMYFMALDGTAPTQRLGPTTRIICQRPDTDVDVRFVRPAAAPSNAAVAGQDLVDSPAWQLQSTNIGDFDTYLTADEVTGDAIRTMAMVHTVGVKVLAANLEPDVHAIRPYAKAPDGSGGEAADDKVRALSIIPSLPAGRTIRHLALRPTDTRIYALGDASSIYMSGLNYDTSSWTKVVDGNDGGRFVGCAFRSDGVGVMAWENGSMTSSRSYQLAASATITYPGAALTDYAIIASSQGVYDIQISNDNATWIASIAFANAAAQQVNWSTNPVANFSIRQQSGSFPGGSGGGKMFKTPTTVGWALDSPTGQVGRTVNNATSLTNHSSGENQKIQCFTYDGVAVLSAVNSNDAGLNYGPRIRRSVDHGVTFTAVTAAGSNVAGGNATLNRGASNTATQESIFVGSGGAIVATLDGINFKQLPRLTTDDLHAVVCLPNGDFIIGGLNGRLLKYGAPGKDTLLQPLAGYSMAYGSAVFNPATGLPWTAAEAADSQFGVRLVS